MCRTLDDVSQGKIPTLLERIFTKESDLVKINIEKVPFYVNLFVSIGRLDPWLENITNYEINVLMNQNSKKTKKYNKYLSMYRNLDDKQKRSFYILLVNLSNWDEIDN